MTFAAVALWGAAAAAIVAIVGCAYLAGATLLVGRFVRTPARAPASPPAASWTPSVTLLKPLYRAEPALFDNLASFCVQHYAGPVQTVLGVRDADDPAIAVAARLRSAYPDRELELVVDPTVHGPNGKVSNLVNMARSARGDVVVVSDSDIRVPPDYLARVIAALGAPGVGGVTCLYYEPPSVGVAATLSALGVNAHFLPTVVVGLATGRARPCFGSTVALRRETLDAIGGFASLVDCLADDYALGEAIRAHAGAVVVPPFAVAHVCRPMRIGDLWRHELRWARTIKGIDLPGYAGSVVTHPLPFAVFAAGFTLGTPWFTPAFGLVAAAMACRVAVLTRVRHAFALPMQAYWLLPLRDLFSFVVFLASFLGRGVSWQGHRFRVLAGGTLAPHWRSPKP